ncbi:hypothetical protein [Loigolactobacillus jiayinensis]|uniref:Uncharacterized protein n=1 Tax=Loigolactobacillus jiayinensis TaxID=2486016 RepID=A0ABW1RIE8_9LACO|nr:hypothetical protein [Loigolactobacillus jiayinensis]
MKLLMIIILALFLIGQSVILWLLYRRNQRNSGSGSEAKWLRYYHNGWLAAGVVIVTIGFCSLLFYGGTHMNIGSTLFYCLVVDFCAYDVPTLAQSK